MILQEAKNHIKRIVDTIQRISGTYGTETVYRDWCEMFALSIANNSTLFKNKKWEQREARYLDIIKRYKEDAAAVEAFPEMCGELTLAFEVDPFQDYLGSIYMELFGGNKKLGQCFTPIDLCRVCAATTFDNVEPDVHHTITLGDECCGGGAMIIAACGYLKEEKKINYQRWLAVKAADLDTLCVHMTYIQLSLLGVRAEVYHQDTITYKQFDVFITPMARIYGGLPPQRKEPEPKEEPQHVSTVQPVIEEAKQLTLESLIQ